MTLSVLPLGTGLPPYGESIMQRLFTEIKPIPMLLVVGVMFLSCTSYRAIKVPDDVQRTLQKGDSVKIVTKDGRELSFEVIDITAEAIIGDKQRILFSDIDRLEKRQFSPGKTAGLTGGILVAGFLAILIGITLAVAGFSYL